MTPLRGYSFSVLVSLVSLNACLPMLRIDFLLDHFFNAASFIGEVTGVKSISTIPLDGTMPIPLHVGHSVTRPASQYFIILKTYVSRKSRLLYLEAKKKKEKQKDRFI